MNNEQLKNAISVDVEDYFHVAALSKVISVEQWSTMESRVVRNTQQLLELFDRHSVKCTFFVLGWVADKHPGLVKEIAQQGHEVACHGYSHQLIYKQTPDVFRQETIRSKQLLEDLSGQPVIGYRAASYSITPKSEWALDILVETGFEYDSSIFPVRHDNYGMPDARREPHRITTPAGNQLVEFPPSVYKVLNYHVPVAGGGYFRLFPYAFTRFAFRRLNAGGLPAMFYLHPWEIDPGQPRFDNASLLSRFRHYNNLDVCEQRLTRLIQDFEFTTVAEVLVEQNLLSSPEQSVAA